jgi:acetamidase/formamidase
VLTIDPGDSVRLRTLDAWWSTGPYVGENVADRPKVPQFREGFGHALIGPIGVRGARPGWTLVVDIHDVVPANWGTCAEPQNWINAKYGITDPGVIHAWELDARTLTGRNQHGHEVALRPFLGIMGMPPAETGLHLTYPPRLFGGNLDCKELVAGSTLYLPIPIEGGLFSAGDGHAAQGDGEVAGTAIECPMERVDLTFDIRPDWPFTGPVAQTPAGWITIGLGDDLDEAALNATESMLLLLDRLYGVSKADALALASVVVDLRVTQNVNGVVGAHALLPAGAIR